MRINNIGEFKTYLVSLKLDSEDQYIADFVACVMQYSLICSCKKSAKLQKMELCNQKYTYIVNNILPLKKEFLFSQTTDNSIEFFNNQNYHIATLLR